MILVKELAPRSGFSSFIHHVDVFPLFRDTKTEMRLAYSITVSTYQPP